MKRFQTVEESTAEAEKAGNIVMIVLLFVFLFISAMSFYYWKVYDIIKDNKER
jgi:hypothetical protein